MSHFTVTVCLLDENVRDYGLHEALNLALAPYDENRAIVPAYRDYESGEPRKHWFLAGRLRDLEGWHRMQAIGREAMEAELLAKHTEQASKWDSKTPEEHTQAEIGNYDWAGEHRELLEGDITWTVVSTLYNEKYDHSTNLPAVPGADGNIDDEALYVDEEGRAYSWTSYNPNSKWDWWLIGGRWRRHFLSVPEPMEHLVQGESGIFGDGDKPTHDSMGGIYCDGGQIRDLDLDGMRDRRVLEKVGQYDQWQRLLAEHGGFVSWSQFRARMDAGELGHDEAAASFRSQPVLVAAQDARLVGVFADPSEEFQGSREEYMERIRNEAVVGFALLAASGEWAAPGNMGWFGASDDTLENRAAFYAKANEYIDALPKDTWLVQVDCHI